jgi:hypothetical protein
LAAPSITTGDDLQHAQRSGVRHPADRPLSQPLDTKCR